MTILTKKQAVLTAFAALLTASILSVASRAQEASGEKAAPATGTVTGRVFYSDTKAPARLAQIILVKLSPAADAATNNNAAKAKRDPLSFAMSGFGQTGLDGRFELTNVPAGKYIAVAQQNGFVNPIARIDISVLNNLQIPNVLSPAKLTEDKIKDYLSDLTIVTVIAGKTVDVPLSLARGASISGVLSYDDGSPAVGVPVHLLRKSKSGSYEEPSMMSLGAVASNSTLMGFVTDDQGHFRIAGLAGGSYALRATLPLNLLKNLGNKLKSTIALSMASPGSFNSVAKHDEGLSVFSGNVFAAKDLKPIEVGEGEAVTGADITIPFNGMHSVQAHVEDSADGHAIDLAQVELLDADGKETLRTGFVDDDGNCTFDYVPDGQYTLQTANALDTSPAEKPMDGNYDPKKIIRYSQAKTKITVSGDVSGIVLQVTKVAASTSAAQ
jgi:hypothetical protein